MPDPTTTNLVLAVPTRGSDVGTWDTPVNGDMNILDACAGSVTATSLSNSPVTLSTTQSQVAILRFTGVLSGSVVVTLGAVIKSWIFENLTTGAFTITISGGSGNVIALPDGSCQAYWDGVNMKFINLGRVGQYWDQAVSAVPAWVTACTVPPALNCDGTTFSAVTYPQLNKVLAGNTLPSSKGRARYTLNQGSGVLGGGGIDGNTILATGGVNTVSVGQTNLPALNLPLSASFSSGTVSPVVYSPSGSSPLTLQTGANVSIFTVTASVTGTVSGTAATGGSGTALATVPPGYVGGITMIWAL